MQDKIYRGKATRADITRVTRRLGDEIAALRLFYTEAEGFTGKECEMMELPIRQLYYDERKYTYAQSQQLRGQTGSIGHLRGDFGSGGQEFYTSWDEHNSRLKTPEFSSELDEVINALRSEEYGLLKSRPGMAQFARKYPDSAFKGSYTTEHGFRVDTENTPI